MTALFDDNDPEKFADPDCPGCPGCPGCRGGDKVPAFEHFCCPVCNAEWPDEERDPLMIERAL